MSTLIPDAPLNPVSRPFLTKTTVPLFFTTPYAVGYEITTTPTATHFSAGSAGQVIRRLYFPDPERTARVWRILYSTKAASVSGVKISIRKNGVEEISFTATMTTQNQMALIVGGLDYEPGDYLDIYISRGGFSTLDTSFYLIYSYDYEI